MNKKSLKLNIKPVGRGCLYPPEHRRNDTKSYLAYLTSKNGITLIVLIITIILILILVGVTVNAAINGGLFDSAKEANFKQEMANIKEAFDIYIMEKSIENIEFETGTLNATKNLLTYNTKEDLTGDIYTVLANAPQKYVDKFEIIKGELIFSSQNKKQLKWAEEMGIKVNPYLIVDGVLLSAETNLYLLEEETGTLVIPSTVTSIGEGAFANIEGLRKIIIPSTVKEIQRNAFNGNKTLEEVIIVTENGEGLEKIKEYAFANCSSLTSIHIKDTVTEIGSSAFTNCTSLTDIELSNGLTTINPGVFSNCRELESIIIPEGVKEINDAFIYCLNLRKITLPSSLEKISGATFSMCSRLENIEIDQRNNNFSFNNGILFNKDKTEMIYILASTISNSQTTFIVPDGVTTLQRGGLSSFTQIEKVKLPASINSIDVDFFPTDISEIEIDSNNPNYVSSEEKVYSKDKTILYMCYSKDKSITLEEGIIEIKKYAFLKCNNLETLILPDSLTTIRTQALRSTKLKNITMGKNVNTIENNNYANIENITIDAENQNYMVENGAIYNKDRTILVAVLGNKTEFEIPYGVQRISDGVFRDLSDLTKVTIPKTVVELGNSAFDGCGLLPKIEIPSSVETISSNCFANCSNLKQIIIDKEEGSITGSPWGCMYGYRAVTWLK